MGSVGLRYGLFFVNGVSNQISVSGWLKKDFEVGSGLSIGYSRDKSTNVYNNRTVQNNNGQAQPATDELKRSSSNIVLQINPFMNKHFFLKEAIDLYVGVYVPFELRIMTEENSETITTSENYLSQYITKSKSPLQYGIGAGLTLGCNYFVTKNFAVGVSSSISGVYNFSKGKRENIGTSKFSGSNNPLNGQSSNWEEKLDIDNQRFYLNANESIGINISYYFNAKKAAKTDI